MQFGVFSNGQRRNQIAADSYDEDLEELILADELGFREAWISEHGVFVSRPEPDHLPSADILIAKAAALTKQIKFGPGIRPLPFFHPLQVATDAAVCDHITRGRYMAGFGLGLGGGGEPRGKMPGAPREMAAESIDFILRAWSEPEPFDFEGRFWQVKNARIVPMPYTKPRMEVGIACSRTDSTMELAARKGFLPLLTWTTPAPPLAAMIETYLGAKGEDLGAGEERAPSRQSVRVGRFVYIADSVAQAKRELANADIDAINRGRLDGYIPAGGTRGDIDLDYLIDSGAFVCGDVDRVAEILAEFHHDVGGFGALLLVCGKDWGVKEGRDRTWRQFMAEVAPKLAAL